MKINIIAIFMLLVVASCTKKTTTPTTGNNMSKMSFDYIGSAVSGSYLCDIDLLDGMQKGNGYRVLSGSTNMLTIGSHKDLVSNYVNISNSNNSTTFTGTAKKLAVSNGITPIIGVNGFSYSVVNERDSLKIDYSATNNKMNGTFSGRLTCLVNNGGIVTVHDSIIITNGKIIDVPLLQ